MGKTRFPGQLWVVFLLSAALFASVAAWGKVIYVDADALGANDGTSWENAYFYLQDALMFAVAGDEIRVAQGVYKPDDFVLSDRPSRGREETFQLVNGVTLKGGYAGFGGPDPNARDIVLYETILSGDLDGNDATVIDPEELANEPTRAENSYHVLNAVDAGHMSAVDGLTIVGGNANGRIPANLGAGIYLLRASATVTHCTLTNNSASAGGAIYSDQGGTISNCTIMGNVAGEAGAIDITDGQIADCVIRENVTTGTFGAAITAWSYSEPVHISESLIAANKGGGVYLHGGLDGDASMDVYHVTACTIKENTHSSRGGGIQTGGFTEIKDCTFTGNSAPSGGGLCNRGYAEITNCTFEENRGELGGAIDSPLGVVVRCVFLANTASKFGGAIFSNNISLSQCLLAGNLAMHGGDAISAHGVAELTNCTVAGNYGDGRVLLARSMTLNNCIIRGWIGQQQAPISGGASVTASWSNIQGGWPGEGNINTDPCFAAPGYWAWDEEGFLLWIDGDYHLKSQGGRWEPNEGRWVTDDVTSPCIDAGDPMSPIGLEPFPNGGIINMGAYGGTAEASKSYFGGPPCETIVAGDVNGDCIVDFKDFFFVALHWLEGHN